MVWMDWDPARLQGLVKAVDGFRARHPRVEFDLAYYPTDQLKGAFEQAAADKQGPTILIGPSTWGRTYADQGWIRDLTELVLPSQQASLQPVAWAQVADSTRVVGLPLTMEGNVLYRNASLVADPAMTVADLVRAAQALKTEQGFEVSLDFGFMISAPQLSACGASLDTRASTPFDEASGECWLGLMQRLGQAGRPVFNTDDDLSRFESGQSAWLIESTARMEELAQAIGEANLAIDAWPLDADTGQHLTGYVWTENAYLTSTARGADLEASWAFMAYLLAPETQASMDEIDAGRRVPSVVGVPLADPVLAQARTVLEGNLPRPYAEDLNRLTGPLDTALRLVVGQSGKIPLVTMATLQEIQKLNLATPTATATRAASPTPLPTLSPSPTFPPP